ncbi:MAG: energy-coupling factor transporter transmembrane protein EcfT [candidate division KSB1 bacterium]|nr:energy-coupling factor transporter transmembrane protein EcfT [candidate division KSB1 bacterium]MDZ7341446.1 energy-coupling factor transporter transmembrane protein EcfT [candidate division KSB1 bacterium]
MKSCSCKPHFLTMFLLGGSATAWAVYAKALLMPLIWLLLLSFWIIISAPSEFKMFWRRFYHLGLLLFVVSFLQIIFRRQGAVLVSLAGMPLVYSEGLREAVLLWIRLSILFMLAFYFAQASVFEFLIVMNKIRLPLQLSLLLLTTLKFIPFVFDEAQRGLWTIRFRGIDVGKLKLREKLLMFRKLLIPILFRGMHFASYSSLALELRGYGISGRIIIDQRYPLRWLDYLLLVVVVATNAFGIWVGTG